MAENAIHGAMVRIWAVIGREVDTQSLDWECWIYNRGLEHLQHDVELDCDGQQSAFCDHEVLQGLGFRVQG